MPAAELARQASLLDCACESPLKGRHPEPPLPQLPARPAASASSRSLAVPKVAAYEPFLVVPAKWVQLRREFRERSLGRWSEGAGIAHKGYRKGPSPLPG